ncbi:hypothetical protein QMK38_19925, partial [Lysinibacillus fusiformis]|nr:hypothetical protein [Lysinibacillus fusiformis]
SSVFTDADNDTLSLTAVSSIGATATVDMSGNTLTITPGIAGTSTITVTANDGNGGTVLESFIVTINDPQTEAAPALFFSETIWGSLDLALEVYNPTNEEIDLSQLKIMLPEKEINFESFGLTLKPGEVLAVLDEWFILENYEIASEAVTRVPFNIEQEIDVDYLEVQLVYGDQVIDTIQYKKDMTMVRKSGVTQGSTSYNLDEWSEFPASDLDHIGTHTP